jgi:hypothetical protein
MSPVLAAYLLRFEKSILMLQSVYEVCRHFHLCFIIAAMLTLLNVDRVLGVVELIPAQKLRVVARLVIDVEPVLLDGVLINRHL